MKLRCQPLLAAAMALTSVPFAATLAASPAAAHRAPSTCTLDVGGTGLSAAVVARPHQHISRWIDATGCDIGVYVGAGVRHVSITSTTVTGANFQGIFAEKTSDLRISWSTVTDNAFNTIDPTAPPLPGSGVRSQVGQAFAISLFGVSNATVSHNRVYNNGRGGIGVMDNGPFDPGAMMSSQDPDAPVVNSWHVRVDDNATWANDNGCGVVAATQNVGGRLGDIAISGNRITGTGVGAAGPDIGGIVVAADLPGSGVSHADVAGNIVRDSFEAGLIVNAEAPGSWTAGVLLHGNILSGNNVGHLESPNTTGVITFAADGAANYRTKVWHNFIFDQFYGVWSRGDFAPRTFGNLISVSPGGTPISLG